MYILKQLKKDMEFNRELFQILEVFKNIAASELHKLQAKRRKSDEFFKTLEGIFATIDWQECSHFPLLKQDKSLPQALVAVTSDEGFSGGLNSMVLSTALSLRSRKEDELIVLGERGARFLEDTDENFIYFESISQEIEYNRAVKLANFLIGQYLRGRWSVVSFVYPHFVSVTLQEVKVLGFLPYKPRPCTQGRGKRLAFDFGEDISDRDVSILRRDRALWIEEIIVEPSWMRVIDYLVHIWAASTVYEIFWESKLSEWAARIIHLEGSVQTLSEWYKDLRLRYLKCMHELRDINIREIFASRLNE